MTTSADALRALAAALDALADALVSGQPDRVLAAEAPLSISVRELTGARPAPGERGADVRAAAIAVRAAMLRCERLGRVSADLERLRFSHRGYGPAAAGAEAVTSISGARA